MTAPLSEYEELEEKYDSGRYKVHVKCRSCGEDAIVSDGEFIAVCMNKDCDNYEKYAVVGSAKFNSNYMKIEL